MRKYKKALASASCVIVLNIIFTFLILNNATYFSSMYVHLLNDYSYVFFFFIILFVNLFDSMEEELIVYKFKRVENYIKFKLIEKVESYGIFFISVTLFQIILYLIVDSNIEILLIVYSNAMFFLLIMFTYLLIIIGKTSKKIVRLSFLFLFWDISYFISILNPTSIYNYINIFTLTHTLEFSQFIRYSFIIVAIMILCVLRISNKRRYITLWLE